MNAVNGGSAAHDAVDRRTLMLIVAALMLVMLLASLSQTVLSTALPTIVGALDGADHILWVITAYLLSSTVMMPIQGRLSDQFGRKPILLWAVSVFTVGSFLGAIATSMPILIVARIVQGLGGGGLMVLSQAAIADVVPARERGKYMGFIGVAFAFSSVVGPLLGGWFTEGPGWRWAFWINVPLGIAAFVVTALLLRKPARPAGPTRPDYLGMMLLSIVTTTLVLGVTWGGHQYAWVSPQIIALAVATIVGSVAFLWAESRAAEPIIPVALFKDRNFNLTTIGSLALGIAMFGSISYMPTYLQMAMGVNATHAGLMMISMMSGLLITAVGTGIIISRTGKYRRYPIAGAAVMMLGLYLMSTITVQTSRFLIELFMLVLGVGIGLGMQVMTLIVQNSFPHAIVGTATAANNYFRQVGATLGSAVVGSIFTARLLASLKKHVGAGSGAGSFDSNALTPDLVRSLPEPVRKVIVEAYNDALMPVFLGLVPLMFVSLVCLWFVREIPLARTVESNKHG
ncbi:MAG: DHA2 family efflux MFS transporter permease subunit [Aeromicrobium sp.]|nr:MAG: DHA2 family efflux MFS transporter permease subunit [Aeromicrobium sp.]